MRCARALRGGACVCESLLLGDQIRPCVRPGRPSSASQRVCAWCPRCHRGLPLRWYPGMNDCVHSARSRCFAQARCLRPAACLRSSAHAKGRGRRPVFLGLEATGRQKKSQPSDIAASEKKTRQRDPNCAWPFTVFHISIKRTSLLKGSAPCGCVQRRVPDSVQMRA